MGVKQENPQDKDGKKTRFSTRLPALLFGSCLSSLPAKYVDVLSTNDGPAHSPSTEPATLSQQAWNSSQWSVEEIVDNFFNTRNLISDAQAGPTSSDCPPPRLIVFGYCACQYIDETYNAKTNTCDKTVDPSPPPTVTDPPPENTSSETPECPEGQTGSIGADGTLKCSPINVTPSVPPGPDPTKWTCGFNTAAGAGTQVGNSGQCCGTGSYVIDTSGGIVECSPQPAIAPNPNKWSCPDGSQVEKSGDCCGTGSTVGSISNGFVTCTPDPVWTCPNGSTALNYASCCPAPSTGASLVNGAVVCNQPTPTWECPDGSHQLNSAACCPTPETSIIINGEVTCSAPSTTPTNTSSPLQCPPGEHPSADGYTCVINNVSPTPGTSSPTPNSTPTTTPNSTPPTTVPTTRATPSPVATPTPPTSPTPTPSNYCVFSNSFVPAGDTGCCTPMLNYVIPYTNVIICLPTVTPSIVSTPSTSFTSTPTSTPSTSYTPTATPTTTPTATLTPTITLTPTTPTTNPTTTPTTTVTPTTTSTPTSSSTPTATSSPTCTTTVSRTGVITTNCPATPTPSTVSTPTVTVVPTTNPTTNPTSTPQNTPSATPTRTPSATPSPTCSTTVSRTGVVTTNCPVTPTPSVSSTPSPTCNTYQDRVTGIWSTTCPYTPTPSPTASSTPSKTPTPSCMATITRTGQYTSNCPITPTPTPSTYYDDYCEDYYTGDGGYGGYYGDDNQPIIRAGDPALVPAFRTDNRYRDMCLSTANLAQGEFDKKTGGLNFTGGTSIDTTYASIYDDGVPEAISPFHAKFVGRVSGAKPPAQACMSMKDTPKVPTIDLNPLGSSTINTNKAFGYYLNLDASTNNFVYNTNRYRDLTDFMETGGVLGCPEIVLPDDMTSTPKKRSNIATFAKMNFLRADYCYNYFILNRSTKPWYTLEKPGIAADDPLTQVDADRAYLSSCQPLINGYDAARVLYHDHAQDKYINEKAYGFAPVLRYVNRPDWDEAEYPLGQVLQSSWNQFQPKWRGVNTGPSFANISLPCISDRWAPISGVSGGPSPAPGPSPSPAPAPAPAPNPSPSVDKCGRPISPRRVDLGASVTGTTSTTSGSGSSSTSTGGGVGTGWDPTFQYVSPPVTGPYYCPNVEKINDPQHPYSPRNYFPTGADPKHATDREMYSPLTNGLVCTNQQCTTKVYGYLGHRGSGDASEPWTKDGWDLADGKAEDMNDKVWNVTCGVVPVDVLGFRQEAFNNCIMPRITYNFKRWQEAGAMDMRNDLRDPSTFATWFNLVGPNPQKDIGWYKCKTRYWETDTAADCPFKQSIQQCCRILTKDVVPANFLKLRTCEGKRDAIRHNSELQKYLGGDADGYTQYDYYSDYGDYADDPKDNNPISTSDPANLFTDMPMFGIRPNGSVHENAIKILKRMSEIPCANTEPSDYLFKTYFGNHMPYMRWWDTGVSAGNAYHGGSFTNTLGSDDTVVGVGREERDKSDASLAKKEARSFDEDRANRLKATQKSEVGRVGGWTELKAHQVQTLRHDNMVCLGRYEKLFKSSGPENFVLAKAGAGYLSRSGQQSPWTLGWRGYTTSTNPSKQFPKEFGSKPGATFWGLDNVARGDIIRYELNGLSHVAYVSDLGYRIQDNSDKVQGADGRFYGPDGKPLIPNRIYVIYWDQGKFPTSTGASISSGMGPMHTIYKQQVAKTDQVANCAKPISAITDAAQLNGDGTVSRIDTVCHDAVANGNGDSIQAQCVSLNCQPSCEDPDLSACILPANGNTLGWDSVQIYRPNLDVRVCDGTVTGAPDGSSFNLNSTYAWTLGSTGVPNLQSDVIYQKNTQDVDTNLWAYCANAGFDPPAHYASKYSGPQAGAVIDTTLCGPHWGECSSAAQTSRYFPRGWGVFQDKKQ